MFVLDGENIEKTIRLAELGVVSLVSVICRLGFAMVPKDRSYNMVLSAYSLRDCESPKSISKTMKYFRLHLDNLWRFDVYFNSTSDSTQEGSNRSLPLIAKYREIRGFLIHRLYVRAEHGFIRCLRMDGRPGGEPLKNRQSQQI